MTKQVGQNVQIQLVKNQSNNRQRELFDCKNGVLVSVDSRPHTSNTNAALECDHAAASVLQACNYNIPNNCYYNTVITTAFTQSKLTDLIHVTGKSEQHREDPFVQVVHGWGALLSLHHLGPFAHHVDHQTMEQLTGCHLHKIYLAIKNQTSGIGILKSTFSVTRHLLLYHILK